MGYYTRFDLKIEGPKTVDANTLPSVADVVRYMENGYDESLFRYDSVKWYEHDEDMEGVSSHWPNVLFTLHGIGEEEGDEWVHYWKGGMVQKVLRPEWTPPAFDESKMKTTERY